MKIVQKGDVLILTDNIQPTKHSQAIVFLLVSVFLALPYRVSFLSFIEKVLILISLFCIVFLVFRTRVTFNRKEQVMIVRSFEISLVSPKKFSIKNLESVKVIEKRFLGGMGEIYLGEPDSYQTVWQFVDDGEKVIDIALYSTWRKVVDKSEENKKMEEEVISFLGIKKEHFYQKELNGLLLAVKD